MNRISTGFVACLIAIAACLARPVVVWPANSSIGSQEGRFVIGGGDVPSDPSVVSFDKSETSIVCLASLHGLSSQLATQRATASRIAGGSDSLPFDRAIPADESVCIRTCSLQI
ncbi:MAG: hypothetical protein H6818_04815 [Phycisphaerales bacterium]|nr:hypothetical protein [Phycisphaerales bacterium]